MSLLQQIKADQLQARKDRDQIKTSALTTLMADAAAVGMNDGKRESTDLEVIAVVKKFIKTINEVIAVTDEETAKIYIHEREIYENYLPQQLTPNELNEIINGIFETIPEISLKSMGPVMKELNQQYAGRFDGKYASQLVRDKLSSQGT